MSESTERFTSDGSVVATTHWSVAAGGKVQCDICPRHCQLSEGQRGLCFVRARQDDAVVLTTFGRSSGYCVDPIEKKPLAHFLPGTPALSFGTAGCNLTCRFCQNWDISKSREVDTLADRAAPELIARAARELGCRSVAFTYNDPVVFMEYAIETARACRDVGVATVAVTAGYVCEAPRREFAAALDAANVDLKGFSDRFYQKVCGAELAPVLDTLVYLRHETDVWLEITTLLIPDENDSDDEIHAMSRWIAEVLGPDVPWHLTAFHPDYRMLDKTRTPASTLHRARDIARSHGIHYVYTGNVHDPDGQSTRCPSCGHLLIERDGYFLGAWNLDAEGCCPGCGDRIPGVFEAEPGRWGSRRQSVRLADYS